jgi:hypothetical protein
MSENKCSVKYFDKRDEGRSVEQFKEPYYLIGNLTVYFMACRSTGVFKK